MVIFRGFRGFSPLTRCIRGRDVSNASCHGHGKIIVANDELDDKKINFYKSLNYCFFWVVVVSLVYEVIIILYVRNDAEAHLWKEEQFEQGIWTLLHISGWDDGEIWAISFARYTWRASLWSGNLGLWCRRKRTAVFGLYEELSKEFSESSIRIIGILRDLID